MYELRFRRTKKETVWRLKKLRSLKILKVDAFCFLISDISTVAQKNKRRTASQITFSQRLEVKMALLADSATTCSIVIVKKILLE